MAEVINLNKARKLRSKAKAVKTAEANRAQFGRSKAQREADDADRSRRDALLDGAKRED